MTTTNDVVAQAERWLGTTEQPTGSNKVPGITDWYGLVGPWCAMAVSRWFFDAGLPVPASTSKGFAYTPSGAAWFNRQGRWKTRDPQRGDVVFFDFPGDGVNRISHVGIVTAVNADGSVNTIEGNTDERGGRTGGKVMRKTRSVGIVGYGVPAYTKETRPMYDPPVQMPPFVAELTHPTTGGTLFLLTDGRLWVFNAPNNGDVGGKAYFSGRKPARVELNPAWEKAGRPNFGTAQLPWYRIVATSGETYGEGGFG